jgi:cyanophycinase
MLDMRLWICSLCSVLLIATVAAATNAQSPDNPLGLCSGEKPGALVICGGGRMREEVYQEFLRLAGGKDAHLVHVPSAHNFSSETAVRSCYSGWLSYDVQSFAFVDAKDREEADDDELVKILDNATGVWIGGGSQGRLANIYGGSKCEAALRRVLERGGVIGGTSAGAAIMSNCMIRYGTATEAVCDKGFGLVSHCVIDQHFAERNRLQRLLGVLEQNQAQVGLGIDEGTAVVLRQDRVKVIGRSRATICVPAAFGQAVTLYRLNAGEEARLLLAGKDSLAWELQKFAKK